MTMVSLAEKIRSELWGFFALTGLFCIHSGIVMSVFALKHVTSHPTLLKCFGVLLVVVGVVATLASWYFHRQVREKRAMFPCCARWCPGCCDCESDLIVLNDEENRRKSRTTERTIAPVSSGLSTLEFKMYSEYIKKDIRGVERAAKVKGIHNNWSQAQNAIYTHQSNHEYGKERRHRQANSPIGKPRFQVPSQDPDKPQQSQIQLYSPDKIQHSQKHSYSLPKAYPLE